MRGYSVAAEVRLPVASWGRSAAVHENVANSLLHDQLLTEPAYRAVPCLPTCVRQLADPSLL